MNAPRRPACLLVAALLVPACALARSQLATITLQQRPAAELAQVLQPLLGPQESVTGDGFTLILNAEPARLEQLRTTVTELDRAPRQLRITVRQELTAEDRMNAAGVSADAGDRHTRVIVNPPDAGSGAQARYRGIGVYGTDPHGRQHETGEQTVLTLEGRPARIAVGLVAPFDSVCEDNYGGRSMCTEYREVSTGFEVLARLGAGGVTLDISPQAQQLAAPGMVTFQVAQTQLRGPLGQWLELGGEVSRSGESSHGVLASTARSGRSARRIAIKVDLAP
ncbi:secretin N-terminal domain-containing protein [Immundisolibacter sp.]